MSSFLDMYGFQVLIPQSCVHSMQRANSFENKKGEINFPHLASSPLKSQVNIVLDK